jgi:beta-N-acetylhexosaminidase
MPRPGARRTAALLLCALTATLPAACTGSRSSDDRSPAPSAAPSSPSGRTTTAPSTSPPTTTAPATTTPATGPEAEAEAALARLDRRQQVLQLFVVGVPLADLAAGAPLAEQGVGGLFLAGRSQASSGDLAATTGQWQAAAPGVRPWVACDQEGGLVQTLKGPGFPVLPSALVQGRMPPDQLAALADGMGASLESAGVTLNLAPVADIVPAGTEASNAPIGAFDRQYGSTAAQVVPAARTVVDGLAAHGVTATLKHFPGLGRVQGNTDVTANVVDDVTTPGDDQVRAFGTLADSPDHPFVMASTAIYERIDPTRVAAFSPAVLTQVLRGQLGFDGVVISDDLGNAASVAAWPAGERAVRFIAAGGTLVLTVDPALLGPMVEAVLNRDRKDPAFSASVDSAVRTALVAKARAGLLR